MSHCHMEYLKIFFNDFLGRQVLIPSAAYVAIHLSDLIKNILICVLKTNEGLTGLVQHTGE